MNSTLTVIIDNVEFQNANNYFITLLLKSEGEKVILCMRKMIKIII